MKKLFAILIAVMLAASLASYAEAPMAGFAGGWNVTESAEMTEDAQKAFDTALSELVGCKYEAVACLGTQVVAGVNYCVLGKITPVYPNAVGHYALFYIYADLQGGATVTNIADLDLGEFASVSVEAEEVYEEDGQNPVMNLIGPYMDKTSQRARMDIACEGTHGASVVISWANSAFETVRWTFSGEFDAETNEIAYANCVKEIVTFAEDGSCETAMEYEGGTGALTVTENWEILWTDDVENAGEGCVFEFAPLAEE